MGKRAGEPVVLNRHQAAGLSLETSTAKGSGTSAELADNDQPGQATARSTARAANLCIETTPVTRSDLPE